MNYELSIMRKSYLLLFINYKIINYNIKPIYAPIHSDQVACSARAHTSWQYTRSEYPYMLWINLTIRYQ